MFYFTENDGVYTMKTLLLWCVFSALYASIYVRWHVCAYAHQTSLKNVCWPLTRKRRALFSNPEAFLGAASGAKPILTSPSK